MKINHSYNIDGFNDHLFDDLSSCHTIRNRFEKRNIFANFPDGDSLTTLLICNMKNGYIDHVNS